LGSRYKGTPLGALGDLSILSFNGNKIITTSGGGALVSTNREWIERARHLATQAREPAPHYQHTEIGYNYRMSNVCAGIGRGQMQVLSDRVEQRRANFAWYAEALRDQPGISFQPEPAYAFSNRWLTAIQVDPLRTPGGRSREDLRLAMEAVNIDTRPLWKPMHLQPVFRDCPFYGEKIAETLFERGLCLPSGSNLPLDHLERVKDMIINLLVNNMQKSR
jgi:dTDP-4-amino-4,6-dideoxygalactose transaminase